MDFIYKFEFPDRDPEEFTISIDYCALAPAPKTQQNLPSWTALAFQQCPHCPLDPADVSHCPVAVNITEVVEKFESLISFHETTVTVTMEDRTYSSKTTIQMALSSLLGLLIATSGCPHTMFLRPMAHFHLPVANTEDTIYRAVGMYYIGQYFRNDMGRSATLDLSGLMELYEKVETVNAHLLHRIQSVTSEDAPLNAIVTLDCFAKSTGMAIRQELEDIRHHWSAHMQL